jgi:hypothetical protein
MVKHFIPHQRRMHIELALSVFHSVRPSFCPSFRLSHNFEIPWGYQFNNLLVFIVFPLTDQLIHLLANTYGPNDLSATTFKGEHDKNQVDTLPDLIQ